MKLKEFWKNRNSWQKGTVLGFLTSFVLSVIGGFLNLGIISFMRKELYCPSINNIVCSNVSSFLSASISFTLWLLILILLPSILFWIILEIIKKNLNKISNDLPGWVRFIFWGIIFGYIVSSLIMIIHLTPLTYELEDGARITVHSLGYSIFPTTFGNFLENSLSIYGIQDIGGIFKFILISILISGIIFWILFEFLFFIKKILKPLTTSHRNK